MDLFNKVTKRLGCGVMFPPQIDKYTVDIEQFQQIVDYLMQHGYNYFETASMYLRGKCESAIKECITSKYPRESYALSHKLSSEHLEDIEGEFQKQLDNCGVDYFDVYLMHGQKQSDYETYKKVNAYERVLKLKEAGKIKHFGISVHDTADVLEQILIEQPAIEFVQIQFNYYDYEEPGIQGKQLYEVCCKYNKKVIAMKPNRGQILGNLPELAHNLLKQTQTEKLTDASYAMRFIKEFDNIWMILSGMTTIEEVKDNINSMENLPVLSIQEKQILDKVIDILKGRLTIPCSDCGYCNLVCPENINIVYVMNLINQISSSPLSPKRFLQVNNLEKLYIPCVNCDKCLKVCTQQLLIPDLINLFNYYKWEPKRA